MNASRKFQSFFQDDMVMFHCDSESYLFQSTQIQYSRSFLTSARWPSGAVWPWLIMPGRRTKRSVCRASKRGKAAHGTGSLRSEWPAFSSHQQVRDCSIMWFYKNVLIWPWRVLEIGRKESVQTTLREHTCATAALSSMTNRHQHLIHWFLISKGKPDHQDISVTFW